MGRARWVGCFLVWSVAGLVACDTTGDADGGIDPDRDGGTEDAGIGERDGGGEDAGSGPACGEVTCGVHATCVVEGDSRTCVCDDGFDGSGTECTDIDECGAGTDDCDFTAVCSNTDGSFTCACAEGWDGDGRSCTNIDECAADPSPCDDNATCEDTDGSFICTCEDGFQGDGRFCADVDECAAHTDGCSVNAACFNNFGGVDCACLPGFQGDGLYCERGFVLLYDPFRMSPARAAADALGYAVVELSASDFASALSPAADLLIIEAWVNTLPPEAEARIAEWLALGKRLIFYARGLVDSASLQATLGLSSAVVSDDAAPHLHRVDDTIIDLFEQQEEVPEEIVGFNLLSTEDPVELTAMGGWLAARYEDADGAGAIAVTHEGRAFIHGSAPYEAITSNNDHDRTPDIVELLINEIAYLLHPRVLVYADSESDEVLAGIVGALGLTSIRTGSADAFAAAFDRSGFDAVAWSTYSEVFPEASRGRLSSWISEGRPTLFHHEALATDTDWQTALGVSCLRVTLSVDRHLYRGVASTVDLFHLYEDVHEPISIASAGRATNEITPIAGATPGQYDSATGPGAIALTPDGATLVNTFLADGSPDGDGDARPDMFELLMNEFVYLLTR